MQFGFTYPYLFRRDMKVQLNGFRTLNNHIHESDYTEDSKGLTANISADSPHSVEFAAIWRTVLPGSEDSFMKYDRGCPCLTFQCIFTSLLEVFNCPRLRN